MELGSTFSCCCAQREQQTAPSTGHATWQQTLSVPRGSQAGPRELLPPLVNGARQQLQQRLCCKILSLLPGARAGFLPDLFSLIAILLLFELKEGAWQWPGGCPRREVVCRVYGALVTGWQHVPSRCPPPVRGWQATYLEGRQSGRGCC